MSTSPGATERYTCAAEPEIRAAAAKLNGFVLIVTHAADPYQLTPDNLMDAFASPLTLAGHRCDALLLCQRMA